MSDPAADAAFMRRAIALAMCGRGAVEPNPMVGCVIARGGQILGEGYHVRYGQPHAEPNALAACHAAGHSSAGATAYVTLEPCCHTNKQTPPCVPRLIEAAVARVVVGTLDPNPAVAGRGVELLRAAGIRVDIDTPPQSLGPECRQLIAPFTAVQVHRRPYVTLKWAQTADGKVAGPAGRRLQISNAESTRAVHLLRARSDAILVGIGTAIADDPLLTTRDVSNARPLQRIVLDSRLRLPLNGKLVATARDGENSLIAYAADSPPPEQNARAATLRAAGVYVRILTADAAGGLSLPALLADLGTAGRVTHLLVEPGPTLARSFLSHGLADRVWVFRSPKRVNAPSAPSAPSAPAVPYPAVAEIDCRGDRLTEYLNPGSPVYFSAIPSPDLLNPYGECAPSGGGYQGQ